MRDNIPVGNREQLRKMPDSWEERALRDAALRGDEEAWRVLFERHMDAAYRYVYIRSDRNRQRAEDTVQEAWMIAVRKLSSFNPDRAPFGAWFHGILTRVLANQRRKWDRQQAREVVADATDYAATDATPASPGNEILALAFTELPAHYQDAIRAKYLDGESTRDIATRWNRTPKAIESILGRAREALRRVYLQRLDESKGNKPK